MPTIRLEYYKGKPLTDGKFPISITVTHKGKPKRKYIDACTPEEWDSKNRVIKALSRKQTASVANRNADIDEAFNKYKKIYRSLVASNRDWNSEDVFKPNMAIDVPVESLTFWDLADKYCEYIKAEKSPAFYMTATSLIEKFKRFVNNEQFKLNDFSEGLINSYKAHMRTLGNKDSTMKLNFKLLRFISKYACDRGLGVKPAALHDFKLPTARTGEKRKLTTDEMSKFESTFALEDSRVDEARDIFLVSYFLRGMRIHDVLKMEQSFIQGNRLLYTTNKNDKVFNMKIPAQAMEILSKYMDGRKYVFRFYAFKPDPSKSDADNRVAEYNHIKTLTVHVNNRLKKLAGRAGISKNISTHIARHSFAKKALDTIKDTNITMDLLGHNSLAVHQAYVRELSKSDDLDDAVDKMFDD